MRAGKSSYGRSGYHFSLKNKLQNNRGTQKENKTTWSGGSRTWGGKGGGVGVILT